MKETIPTKEEIKTALLWVKGTISQREVARRLKRSDVGAYIILARALKAHLCK